MWNANGTEITMCEGDYGLLLPLTVNNATFTAADELRFCIKLLANGETLVEKVFTYSDINKNTVNIELTQAESATLNVGTYCWTLDWYQSGVFLCNVVRVAVFKVVDKA